MDTFFKEHGYTEEAIRLIRDNNFEESNSLEFKGSPSLAKEDKKKKEIAKDVSAMANSAGGFLIYGISEENHIASDYSFVDGNEFSKEWLEQIIQSNVSRKIPELEIHPVRFEGKIQKTVYVIKIPESSNAPHMNNIDNKFYKRYNFQAEAMAEYEVRNLYFRQERTYLTLLEPTINANDSPPRRGNRILSKKLAFRFDVKNIGRTIEKDFKLELSIPRIVYLHGISTLPNHPLIKNLLRHEEDYSIFSLPGNNPIFQDETFSFIHFKLDITKQSLSNAKKLPLKARLYYSSDISEIEVDLKQHLLTPDHSRELEEEDFAK